ncbi:glycosyl transferase family 1 [Candidatus Saccharibacteria bacterium]|nr:MAG: glycosyl transferase family 1 [Candidatus Saccharibacteria bacterium]
MTAAPANNHSTAQEAQSPTQKVAIVHDWLYGGGAEMVVEQLHRLYPDAPVYTSYCSNEWRSRLEGRVVTGWLQHLGGGLLRKISVLPRIWWFRRLDLSSYDLVIISTGNGEAKFVRPPRSTTVICYCHSPNHFYWRHYQQYLTQPGFGALNPVIRLALKLLVGPLRRLDRRAAQRPDLFIANSTHIQSDITTFYGRDSEVVHPPVQIERFGRDSSAERHGFVTSGRIVPHKHVDIIVQACSQSALPLTVVGDGPDLARLRQIAGPTVRFLGRATDQEVEQALASAQAFIFASHDDFGIAPVEAMAAGTPVIAYRAGGALDYVVPGKTGEFFDSQTAESLTEALRTFQPDAYDSTAIRQHAARFSPEHFRSSIGQLAQSATRR